MLREKNRSLYVDNNLNIEECFIGLYQPADTTGEPLSLLLQNVLTMLDLSFDNLRGQSYDGVSNMSGCYNGCQANIKWIQPLAEYFHCSSHCLNLVSQAMHSEITWDLLSNINKLGVLFSRSQKHKFLATQSGYGLIIKPLCPTRWVCRASALARLLSQYMDILESLQLMTTECSSEATWKASSLLNFFQQGSTYLSAILAEKEFSILNELSICLQPRNISISAMLQALNLERKRIQALCNSEQFKSTFVKCKEYTSNNGLDAIALPHRRIFSQRYSGNAELFVFDKPEDYYRWIFFQIIDKTISKLDKRFRGETTGLRWFADMEAAFIAGNVEESNRYPEIKQDQFKVHLSMFLEECKCSSIFKAIETIKQMSLEL